MTRARTRVLRRKSTQRTGFMSRVIDTERRGAALRKPLRGFAPPPYCHPNKII
jgi:hypothetical protein